MRSGLGGGETNKADLLLSCQAQGVNYLEQGLTSDTEIHFIIFMDKEWLMYLLKQIRLNFITIFMNLAAASEVEQNGKFAPGCMETNGAKWKSKNR